MYAVVTPIGGQGHILGRGNQQLCPVFLRHLGRGQLWVVAAPGKLAQLEGRPLLLDSGDAEIDRSWSGMMTVHTGFERQLLYAVTSVTE